LGEDLLGLFLVAVDASVLFSKRVEHAINLISEVSELIGLVALDLSKYILHSFGHYLITGDRLAELHQGLSQPHFHRFSAMVVHLWILLLLFLGVVKVLRSLQFIFFLFQVWLRLSCSFILWFDYLIIILGLAFVTIHSSL